jgi:two-component system CheB/CheR fusion protein
LGLGARSFRTLNQELESRVVKRTAELRATVGALEAEITERLRLEREILEISEREQSRLGQDLHDGLGQELAGIALLGKVLANRLEAESHPGTQAAVDIADYINNAIQSARRLARGLYPVELSRNGLLVALEDLANQTSQRFGIDCELRQCGQDLELKKSAEIHIYRIVQESIGNAIKHGGAPRILIHSEADAEGHTFLVIDNGRGFKKTTATGMGLYLMDYRARVIGATLSVGKGPGGGCQVTCRVPR